MHRIAALLAAVLVTTVAITPPAWADSRDAENWAGYMVTSARGFTTVSARWPVPRAVRCGDDEFSTVAVWVGMDSDTTSGMGANSPIEQAGTLTECRDGQVEYWAFVEAYPAEAELLFKVNPGDIVHARITMRAGTFGYLVIDYNTEESASGELPAKGRGE